MSTWSAGPLYGCLGLRATASNSLRDQARLPGEGVRSPQNRRLICVRNGPAWVWREGCVAVGVEVCGCGRGGVCGECKGVVGWRHSPSTTTTIIRSMVRMNHHHPVRPPALYHTPTLTRPVSGHAPFSSRGTVTPTHGCVIPSGLVWHASTVSHRQAGSSSPTP